MDKCIICGKDIYDYRPEYCCSSQDCGCQGIPIEPPLCSFECGGEFYNYLKAEEG